MRVPKDLKKRIEIIERALESRISIVEEHLSIEETDQFWDEICLRADVIIPGYYQSWLEYKAHRAQGLEPLLKALPLGRETLLEEFGQVVVDELVRRQKVRAQEEII